MTERDEFVDVGGVAVWLQCSPSAVRLWEAMGKIPPAGRITGSGRRVWRLAAIDAFANEQAAQRRHARTSRKIAA